MTYLSDDGILRTKISLIQYQIVIGANFLFKLYNSINLYLIDI